MTGRPSTHHERSSHPLPTGYAAFLVDRIGEEIDAALLRPINKPGIGMLVELRNALRSDHRADQTSIDVLTMVYAGHPQFDTNWTQPHSR